MLQAMAQKVASVFAAKGIVGREDIDIYAYAYELIIADILNILICIVVSFIFRMPLEGIIFTVSFAALRRITGGHHAKTHFRCIATFVAILTVSLILLRLLPPDALWIINLAACVISVIVTFFLAPIGHENKPLNPETRRSLKKKSRVIVPCAAIVITAGTVIHNLSFFSAGAMALAAVSGSMIFACVHARDIIQK